MKTDNKDNIKFSYSSKMIDFPFVQDDVLLKDFINKYKYHIDKIENWTLIINVSYTSIKNHHSFLWISKQGISYKKDKEKTFTIQLPIPSIEEKSWGIQKKQITPQQPFVEKYFNKIEININKYNNLENYVNQLIMEGIDELFKFGFTFNDVKINSNNNRNLRSLNS